MDVAASLPARLGTLGRILVLAGLYYGFGKLSFSLSVTHGIVTLVVFASEGIALGALILGGARLWPGVFLGQYVLALSGGLSPALALGISVVNSVEAVLGAHLYRRLGLGPKLERMSDVAGLLLLIALVLQPFSAALGTTLLRAAGRIPGAGHGGAFLSWWFGNLMGQFLFTPFLLSWSVPGILKGRRLGHHVAMAAGTLLASLSVFGCLGPGLHNASLVYAVLSPLMVAIAILLGPPGATLSVLVVTATVLVATHRGLGPFAALKGLETWIDLNVFLVGTCLTSLFVAALFAERKRSEGRAQRLADANLIGVILFRLDGLITGANDAFLRLVGRDRETLEGGHLSWAALTPPGDRDAEAPALEELRIRGASTPYETEVLHARGARIPVLVGAALFEDDPGEGVAFVLDLTAAKEQDRLKSQFVSLVSHELRTPLTSILGSLGLLRGGALGELARPVMDILEIAHRNTERLVDVVNDILDLEKLTAGQLDFHFESVDLVAVVRRALEDNRAYAGALGIALELREVPEAAPARLDVRRTLQVLANLLSNASKFSPAGSTVTVDVRLGPRAQRVDVIDRGPGIPEAFQKRIFQPFTQAETTDALRPRGTGLGLSIAKSMVERMGGRIGFVSEAGHGTTFSIELPHPPPEAPV